MKHKILYAFLCLGMVFSFVACSNSSSSGNSQSTSSSSQDEKRVPIYQGVSFASQETYQNRQARRKEKPGKFDDTKIEEAIKNNFGVLTSEELTYYTIKGEKAYITLNFYNPDQFEILSFVLNGVKYQTFQFTEDSTAEAITVGVTIPNNSGVFEYHIEQVKYIDGNEIKDCKMEGNQTIRVGIGYDVTPDVTTNKVETSYTDVIIDTTIVDNAKVVENSKGEFKIFVFDKNNVLVSSQPITLGKNNAHFKNLEVNEEYRYVIACTLDKMDGEGMNFDILEEGDITTKNYIELVNKVITTSSISLDINAKVEELNITESSLYLGDELIDTKKGNQISFENLLSNGEYKIAVKYVYNEKEFIYEEIISTLGILNPQINLEVSSTKNAISYLVGVYDENEIFNLTNIELIKEGIIIDSKTLLEGTFENLLSNTTYQVKVNYAYDLNDGHGLVNEFVIKEITTKELKLPSYGFNYSLTDNVISGNLIVIDEDAVSTLTSISLYRSKDNLLISNTTNTEFSFETAPNTGYNLVVNYKYNLNDGQGELDGTYSINLFSTKTAPTFEIKPISLTSSSMEFDLDIKDLSLTGQVKSIYLYKDTELVSKVPTTNYLLESLLSNTEYRIVVEYAYDLDDGIGPQVLEKEYTFTTLKEVPSLTISEEISENSIRVNPIIVDKDNSGSLTKVELYLNQQLVAALNENYVFENLLSNTKYEVKCYYTYDINLGANEVIVTKEITTEAVAAPTVDVELSSTKNSISYKVLSGSANIINIELIKNGVTVQTLTDLESTFLDVLSGNEYTLKVNYEYDLNDGKGVRTGSVSKTITTKTLIEPAIAINTTMISDKEISGNIIVEDIDNICRIINISLYQNGSLVYTINGGSNYQFQVQPNVTYQVVVNYEYNLNDGEGLRSNQQKVELTSYKELPSISIYAYNITRDAIYYDLYLTDTNNVGYLKSMRLYQNGLYIKDLTQYDGEITGLQTNTNYSIVSQYLYDFNDGLGSREITYTYDFKTLKNSPEYYLNATSGTKDITINHNISDIDNALKYQYTKLYLNGEIVKEVNDIQEVKFNDLLSNTLYRIEVGFICDVNNGEFDYIRSIEIYTQELAAPYAEITANSDKTNVTFDYEIIDTDKVIKSSEVYLENAQGIRLEVSAIDNKFTDLLSDNSYRLVLSLICDFNDGRELRTITYSYDISTLALEVPSVDLEFESTVDSIKYTNKVVDNDNVLVFDSLEVYLDNVLVTTITDLSNKVIAELESNSIYKFKYNYHYNLNDGKGDIYTTYEEEFSTLAHSVEVLGYELVNSSTPKTNEDIVIKVTISNLSQVELRSVIVNGNEVAVVGGNMTDHIIIVVDSGNESGQVAFRIEEAKYYLNGFLVSQEVTSEESITVEVLSRLNILSIQTIDGANVYKDMAGYNFAVKIDNPNGYKLKTIKLDNNTYNIVMLSNNYITFYVDSYFGGGSISEITYIDENGHEAVRKYHQEFNLTALKLSLDNKTYALDVRTVSTPEEFLAMENGKAYELISDIDMSGYAWTPRTFDGYFDGKGHTIKNLTMIHENEYEEYQAVAFYSISGIYRNVFFENIYINYQTKGSAYLKLFDIKGESVSNVLISGSVNINADSGVRGGSIPEEIYIVGDFYLNGSKLQHYKNIAKEEFNQSFKEETLGWIFAEKEYDEFDGFNYTIIDDSYIFINKYVGMEAEVEIPESINGKPVVGIGDFAFKDCKTLKSITFNDKTIYYGGSILAGCSSLEKMNVLNSYSLTQLFGGLEYEESYLAHSEYVPLSLKTLLISEGVTSIREGAFNGYSSLTSVVISEGVTVIGPSAFSGCSNLKEIQIPNSVEKIDTYAFSDCQSLQHIEIPSGIKEIPYGVCQNCENLENIILPKSIEVLSEWLVNCHKLENLYYKGTMEDWLNIKIKSAYSNAMNYASHFYMLDGHNQWYEVTSIEIPDSITTINDYAFYGVNNIRYISIPTSVTTLGKSCLDGAEIQYIFYRGSEEECTYKDYLYQWNMQVIYNYECHEFISNDFAEYCLVNNKYVYGYCQKDRTIETFNFPELYPNYILKTLAPAAFENCINLSSVDFGVGLERIDNQLFNNTSITELTLPEGLKHVSSCFDTTKHGMTKIVFPSTLETVWNLSAWEGTLVFNGTIPPTILGWNTSSNYNVYVPKESLEAYKSIDNEVWQIYVVGENKIVGCEQIELDILMGKVILEDKFVKYDGESHSLEIQGNLPEEISVVYEGNNQSEAGCHKVEASFYKNGVKITSLQASIVIYSDEVIYEAGTVDYLDYSYLEFENSVIINSYRGDAKHLVIPSIIKEGDKMLAVKQIGAYAFTDTDAESIIIPSSIEVIDYCAFDSCDMVSKVIFLGAAPMMEMVAFNSMNATFKIYVPEEYYDSYLAVADPEWQKNIVEGGRIETYSNLEDIL